MLDRRIGRRAKGRGGGSAHRIVHVAVQLKPDRRGRLRGQGEGATEVTGEPQGTTIDAEEDVLAIRANGTTGPVGCAREDGETCRSGG